MLNVKDTILKPTIAAISTTLLLSAVGYGIKLVSDHHNSSYLPLNYDIYNLLSTESSDDVEIDNINVSLPSIVLPNNEKSTFIKLKYFGPYGRCALGITNGKTYFKDALENTVVNTNNTDGLCQKLRELCEKYNHTRGVNHNSPDRPNENWNGWQQSPWEYYFTGIGRYNQLSNENKKIFAQEIEIMYQHKDDPAWDKIINQSTANFCYHAGHCSQRAAVLVNIVHSNISKFLSEINGESVSAVRNSLKDSLDYTFSELKREIVSDVRQSFLFDNGNDNENVYVDYIEKTVKYLLGMTKDNADGIDGHNYFNYAMNSSYLIKKLDLMVGKLSKIDTDRIIKNADKEPRSFEYFCRISGMSPNQKRQLKDAINSYEDDDSYDDLKEWVNNKKDLSLYDLVETSSLDEFGYSEFKYNGLAMLMSLIDNDYIRLR